MQTPTVPASPADADSRGSSPPDHSPPLRGGWVLVVAAFVGGLAGWAAAESWGNPFPPPAEMQALLVKRGGTPLSEEEAARLDRLETGHATKNAAASLAMFALPVGAAIGLAAGLLVRSGAIAPLAMLAGAVLAGIAAAAAGWIGVLAFSLARLRIGIEGTYSAMAAHAVVWTVIALALSAAVALVLRRSRVPFGRLTGGAVLGGLAAALLYPVIVAVALPMSNTELLVPEDRWARLVWIELAAGLIAAGIVRSSRPRPAGAPGVMPAA